MKRKRLLAIALALVFAFQGVPVQAEELPSAIAEDGLEDGQEDILKKPETGLVENETQKQLYEESVPVADSDSAQVEGQTGNGILLSEETIQYNSYYSKCAQIPFQSRGGIYFLNDRELMWYQLDTQETTLVHTFDSYADCYVTESKLYFLRYNSQIVVYDLNSQSVERTISFSNSASAIGADSQGRIYLAGPLNGEYQIYLLSSTGELLSQTASAESIYSFSGFDSSTGNFYVEGYANWVYWGYNHDMNAVRAGRVSGDTISFNETILMYACQAYWYERQGQVQVMGNKYLCVDSTFQSYLSVWDSSRYNPAEPEDTEVFALSRNNTELGPFDSEASVGVRAVYREDTDTMIAYKNSTSIAEYDIASGTEIVSYQTDYPVFALLEYGDDILAIERSGNQFYYELISWQKASGVTIQGDASTLKAGETIQLSAQTDGTLSEMFSWSSGDPKVASINQDGEVFGWRAGTAVITVTTQSGLSAQYTVTVTAGELTKPAEGNMINTNGEASSNRSANNYSVWSNPVNSYLLQNDDGTFTRVEYCNDKVIVETFSSAGTREEAFTIPMELNLFGGFYSGDDNYYFVFGQMNTSETDDTEVMRVVRYSKDFQRVDALSVYGANTYIPFSAGSLRMTETGDKLYIHTCHEMYTSDDGLHHQANMTYVVNKSDMSLADSYYDVMNIAQAGYVSHSFNQFVKTDGSSVFRVDHGDAFPRGISITRCQVDGSIEDVSYTIPIPLSNVTGYNPTGASVGGFELSADNCIIAGNAVDYTQEEIDCNAQRNIFVSITDQDLQESSTVWLTDYNGTENVSVYTPHLVKIGECQFLVMWEEDHNGTIYTYMATIDDAGNLTSEPVRTMLPLSDCAPIYCGDGLVRWYTTQGGSPGIYEINPLDLEAGEIAELPFTDVDMVSGSWFYNEVANVYEKQLMTGLNATTFGPYDSLARAQFAVIIHRMEGEEAVSYTPRFPDVASGQWYTDAILWAADTGIVTGYTNTGLFGPADRINREQMAVMMYRYAGMKGYDTGTKTDFSSYQDASSVDEFAVEAMQWAVGCGIITGKYDNTILDPHGNASRAECAIILTRFMNYYGM